MRRLALRIVLLPPADIGVEAAERHVYFAFFGIRAAFDDGPVGLVDRTVAKQLAELRQRLAMAAENEAAGCIAVEPVRQCRGARQPKTQRIEVVFQGFPAPILAVRRAAVHGHAGRLVDHQHQPVAIEEPRHHLFRSHVCLPWRNGYHGRRMQETPQDSQSNEGGETAEAKQSWWRRLSGGLKRSSTALTAISDIVTKRMLDEATIEEIHDALVRADLGIGTADRIADTLSRGRHNAAITPDEVKAVVAAEVEKALAQVAQPLVIDTTKKPFVILVAGVNGSGKTTTIGKLAAKFRAEGRSVMLAAGDTFRAAAIEQLKIWATRSGTDFIAREAGADAAGLAFDAVRTAKERGTDILLIDTAGRLQNRTELMEELEKIVRVIKKVDPSAPHAVLLVLDATVGQNALSQAEIFQKVVGVTGLVMTKLDGTARGGILVALAAKFALPVHYVGVGESIDDLAPFSAHDFARAIAGLEA